MFSSTFTRITFFLTLAFISTISLAADQQKQEIKLWPDNEMPYSMPVNFVESNSNGIIRNVSVPCLYFCPAAEKKSDITVIICPGGGYGCVVIDAEGYRTAEYYNNMGINVFILKYRHNQYKQPAPLADVQRAIRLVRRDADKYGINPSKIGIMGFSAGGHLAASASTMFADQVYTRDDDKEISARPDFSILVYPVITMGPETHQGSKDSLLGANPSPELVKQYSCQERVTDQTPPTFIVFATDDDVVPVANGVMYYQALVSHKINAEIHIYNKGGHGFLISGRANQTCEKWNEVLTNWIEKTVK